MNARKILLLLAAMLLAAMMIPKPQDGTLFRTALAQNTVVTISQIYNFAEPPGATFLVYLNVTDATDLQTVTVNMSWDPTIIKVTEGDPNGIKPRLNATKYDVYYGGFPVTTYWGLHAVNNDEGTLLNLWASRPSGGSNGDGVVAKINFTLITQGTTKIQITGTSSLWPGKSMLLDHSLVEIAHDDVQGILSDKSPSSPEIWTELWFQTTIAIIVIVVLALTFVVYRKRYKPKPEELEESEESEDTDVEI